MTARHGAVGLDPLPETEPCLPVQAVHDLLSALRATLPEHSTDPGVGAVRITIASILRDGVTEFSLKSTAAFLREDMADAIAAARS